MLRIGSLAVDPPVVLAPMAGVTDAPFRVLCARHGGGLFVSEMVTARGLVEGNARTREMVRHHSEERTRSLQLYTSDPDVVGRAVALLVDEGRVDHVDLNFGCPVPKVTRNGGGAALPFKRRVLAAVVRAAVRAADEHIPVTIKMRLGLDEDRLTHLDAGRIAADEGVAAIALHARTAMQGYAGQARWAEIARLRETIGAGAVPVLGNGDIWTAPDAVAMVRATGCDGVVVGRGCLGRPWLFRDLALAFAGREPLGPPLLGEVVATAREHLALALDWEADPARTVPRLRKHLRWYLQGYPVGHELRRRAGLAATPTDVRTLLDDLDPDLAVLPASVAAPRGRTDPMRRLVLPDGWCDDPEASERVAEPVGAVSGG